MAEDSKAYIGPDWYFDHDAGTTDLNIGHDSDGVDYLRFNSGGPVEVLGVNLRIGDGSSGDGLIQNHTAGNVTTLDIQEGGTSKFLLRHRGNASELEWRDSTGTPLWRLNEGGPVEVLNSNLSIPSNDLQLGDAPRAISWNDQGGGYKPLIKIDTNGEIIARDDDGNTTQLT